MSDNNDLKNIGKNGVNEFFEDLTYNVAYNVVNKKLQEILGLDNPKNSIIKDAMLSSLNIMVSSALFLYIQKQEKFIYKIFALVSAIIVAKLNILSKAIKNRLSKMRGVKGRGNAIMRGLKFITDSKSDNINFSRMGVEYGSLIVSGDNSLNSSLSNLNIDGGLKNTILNQESHNLNIARAKVQSINETLLFKLFTKNFTQSDIEMINRICGNKTNGNITKEQLNQVADFMYITDDKGQITGLSEQFLTMLNGLGYMHNKTKKS